MRRFIVFLCAALITIYTNACFAQHKPSSNDGIQETRLSSAPLSSGTESQKENWTELSASRGGLDKSQIKAMVLAKFDFPEYTRELVHVEWRDGDPIDLYVLRPHGVAKPPVILYLYSFPTDDDRFQPEAWGKSVTKGGFAAVGFVSALTGQRYHMRPMNEWFISELQESLGSSVHDVQMVIDYLATRGDVDTAKVGMLGVGSGGTIGILAAAADSRIGFIDAINPWGDWAQWLKESPVVPEKERANYLKPEFLAKVAMLDPIVYLPRLDPEKVRIEEVAGDPATPKSVQLKFSASARVACVIQYGDTKAQVEAWTKQNWWLKEQLAASSATPVTAQGNHDHKILELLEPSKR